MQFTISNLSAKCEELSAGLDKLKADAFARNNEAEALDMRRQELEAKLNTNPDPDHEAELLRLRAANEEGKKVQFVLQYKEREITELLRRYEQQKQELQQELDALTAP